MSIQDVLPKSRITLKYRTEIHGQPEDIVLPLRLLVIGDFSGKNSDKREFEEREVINVPGKSLRSVMDNLQVQMKVQSTDEDDHTINLKDISSFSPAEIVLQLPGLRRLLYGEKILTHVRSSLDNSKKFRKAMMKMIEDKDSVKLIKEKLAPIYKNEVSLQNLAAAKSEE
ncbi:MAG: type VI secretion system contractile sheath small subunit [candidate division Zixibacteria bacterium]|nr:type VI secretion system contractile sheath small subunit [candidate division Zixibacteria bacterium]